MQMPCAGFFDKPHTPALITLSPESVHTHTHLPSGLGFREFNRTVKDVGIAARALAATRRLHFADVDLARDSKTP